MPRYFFDVQDHRGFHRDDIGEEFTDFEEARVQAQALLPSIARDETLDSDLYTIVCEVRDASNRSVYRGELTYRGVVL